MTKTSIELFLSQQIKDDESRRAQGAAGGAHGNLFLQVARSKQKRSQMKSNMLNTGVGGVGMVGVNIRAVCPFSSASLQQGGDMGVVDKGDQKSPEKTTTTKSKETNIIIVKDSKSIVSENVSKCPAHIDTTVNIERSVVDSTSVVSKGNTVSKCPAHIDAAALKTGK